MKSESELEKELVKHNTDIREVREDEFWVNDATRRDLKKIAEKHKFKVFGLKMWRDWQITEAKDLATAKNFQVDYVFKNKDHQKVQAIIDNYNSKTIPDTFDRKLTENCIDTLAALAIMECAWT